ncbi:ABC transporter substrate-binding protein [Radiobacillus deserti]|uniref:ABC transporter substrate-binding protein n=1 Tax=Radiobacillus deserti TaxID=2594883 RepID=A0A516KE64_9BACI|nr:ABC transporter substrate-binding protein [Radiobacillus deserti]QDP39606.1 ABC transporter substrate-binding protein [Radiobacillus deserti]
MDLSYFAMRAHLLIREQDLAVSFKLEELEEVWFCTKRNVKRKLHQLVEQGKCTYIPGKGRGNTSTLVFQQPFREEIRTFARWCMEQQKPEELIQLLQLPIPKAWVTNVSRDVRTLFGMQANHQDKDILRTILARDLSTLDPVHSSITFENHMIKQLGDSLVIYDQKQDKIMPHLAHHWRVNDTYKEWTFYLRKGVRFHHQGIMTSEDVAYTFRRFTKSSPYFWMVKDIKKMECVSPYIIRFQLRNSNPFFLRYLSSSNLSILPKDVPFDDSQWIGTGAFQLKERNNKRIVLEAFDSYFLERPFLDRVEFWKIPSETAQTVSYNIHTSDDIQEGIHKREVEVGFRFLAFNFRKTTVVHHLAFREALFHLMDVQQIQKELGREEVLEASSFFPWKSQPRQRDTNKIEGLLKEANYQGETLQLYSLDFPNAKEEARWLQKHAAQYGIHLSVSHFNLEDFYQFSFDQDADLLLMGEVSTLDFHLSFLGAFYNHVLIFRRFFRDDQLAIIDHHLECFKREEDKDKREEIIEEIEAFIKKEHLLIFLQHPIKNRIFHPMIQSIHLESFGQVDFKRLWIV